MKKLPAVLRAKYGTFRQQKEDHIRITDDSCVIDFDLKMLKRAQPVNGFVEHIPSGERRKAVFTRLKIHRVPHIMLAHRVTGTLYNEHDGACTSPDLRAVVQ